MDNDIQGAYSETSITYTEIVPYGDKVGMAYSAKVKKPCNVHVVPLCRPGIGPSACDHLTDSSVTERQPIVLSPVMPLESFNVYREQLSSLHHGVALWEPNPIEGAYDQV